MLLDRAGRFQARVEGPVSGNVLLRRAQYRASEAPDEIVRSIVSAKIANQRAVLQRALRDHGDELAAGRPRKRSRPPSIAWSFILRRVAHLNEGVEALRGAEGEAALDYFAVFDHLIRAADPDIRFRGRSRRPPLDPVNALLSFLYTLLTHDCRSAAEGVGLDPPSASCIATGPGRPSLALDLMEELRPVLADRLALSLLNRRQLRSTRFRDPRRRRRPADRRWPQDGADRLAGTQEGGATASLPGGDGAARARAASSGAIARAASTRRPRRLSALVLEMSGAGRCWCS